MTKRSYVIFLFLVSVLATMMIWTGCGDDKNIITQPAASSSGQGIQSFLKDFQNLDATIELVKDGESVVIWSHKGDNWRWQDANDENNYAICNADQGVIWQVNGDTAVQLPTSSASYWLTNSPTTLLSYYGFIGNVTGDTLEFRYPLGMVTVELNGPQGFPSKVTQSEPSIDTTQTTDASTTVYDFIYSNVDSVPDDLFQLPENVSVQEAPQDYEPEVPSL